MKFSLRTLVFAALLLPIIGSIIYQTIFPPPKAVVVATSDLPGLAQLTTKNTKVEKWPSDTVSNEWVAEQNEITGKYTRYRVSNGLPIFKNQFGTFDEIVDDLRSAPSPRTNVVTVEWPFPDQGDILGPGPPYGAIVDIYQIVESEELLIAGDVRVVREYKFSKLDYPNTHWLLGVEMTDQQTIRYIDAKQNGRMEIRTVSLNGE